MHLPYPSFSIVVLVTRGFKNSEIVLFNSALPSNNTFAPVKTVKKQLILAFSLSQVRNLEMERRKKKKLTILSRPRFDQPLPRHFWSFVPQDIVSRLGREGSLKVSGKSRICQWCHAAFFFFFFFFVIIVGREG